MTAVKCLYCGNVVPADVERCPHCDAPSHFQRQGANRARQRRFLLWFVLLTLFCLVVAFWLPR